MWSVIKETSDIIWVVCYKLLPCDSVSIIKKLFVSWQFFKTYGVINYGSGWKKDGINQYLFKMSNLQTSKK